MEPLLLALENAGRHGAVVGVILVVLVVIGLSAGLVRAVRSRKGSATPAERDQTRGGGAS